MRRVSVCGLLTSLVIGSVAGAQTPASQQVEWLYYGGDPGGTKYSPLTDIDAGERAAASAWPGSGSTGRRRRRPGFFESTPLMIDGVLYVTTPYNNVAALDAETGKEIWRFDGKAEELGPLLSGSGWKLRGTAFWRDGRRTAPLPQQPASPLLARCADGKTGSRRSATAAPSRSPRSAADLGHHARHAKLAARRLPRPGHRRQPGSRPRPAARSRSDTCRRSTRAPANACGRSP